MIRLVIKHLNHSEFHFKQARIIQVSLDNRMLKKNFMSSSALRREEVIPVDERVPLRKNLQSILSKNRNTVELP